MKLHRGILAALGAAVLFGFSSPIAKKFVGGTPPLMLAGTLYLGSGVGVSILLAGRAIASGRASIVRPGGAALIWLLGAIAVGGVLGPYLLMYGLQTTDAASASLILNLEGVATALIAWFAFKENFDRRIAADMALIVAGGVVLSSGSAIRTSGVTGPSAIAAACLAGRLRRAEGHLATVIAMLAANRPCLDLAQQLHAVEKAIRNAKKELIKDHISHCMEETSTALPREFKTLIKEFQTFTKYL